MKKLVSLMLALCLVLGLVSFASADEPVTINLYRCSCNVATPDADQVKKVEAAINDNSPENMDAFHQYLKEQCYEYGLVSKVNNLAHTTVVTKAATCFRGQILPGACEY